MNDVAEAGRIRLADYGAASASLAPPHSTEAEQAVLGALMQDALALERVSAVLAASDFFARAHRTIFEAIARSSAAVGQVDLVTVGERLRDAGALEQVGGHNYLLALIDSIPSSASAPHYAEIVRNHARRRALIATADKIRETAYREADADTAATAAKELVAEVVASGDGVDRSVPPWIQRMREWEPLPLPVDQAPPKIEHAVQDLIRTGKVGALVAAGGTGKTTLLLHLAVCHATGRPFLGQPVKVGTFVLLSNDDPVDDLRMALAEVAKAMELSASERDLVGQRVRLFSLQGESGLRVFTETGAGGAVKSTALGKLLLDAVEGVTDLVGLALDTLRQFAGGSSNDEQVMKLTVQAATDFATRTGAYVILPHHTGKQNFRDGIADQYCGSGSAAIADNCRFVLLLQTTSWADIESKVKRTGRERGDPMAVLSTRGSLLMRPADPVFFCRDGFDLQRIAGAVMTRDQQADEADVKVLRAIRRGAQTKNAIARVIGGRKKSVIDRVDDLEARGLVESGSGSRSGSRIAGEYVLTTRGVRHLEIVGEES